MTPKPSAALEEPLEYEIDPELQRELFEYAGKWVAITRSTLIAVGDTPRAVYDQARAEGIGSPIIYRVPENREAVYFF